MRCLVTLAIACVASAGSGVCQTLADRSTSTYDIAGLQVIYRHNPGTSIVAAQIFLLGGTRQYTRETAGLEPLLLRSADLTLGRTLARTGALTFTDPGPDWTATGFISLATGFDSSWSAFVRRLVNPVLSDLAVDRARKELLAAARRRYSHPDLRVRVLAHALAFADHPYGLEPAGTAESIEKISRADLETYVREQFVTSRMLLVIVGDIPQARVDALVAETLGRLPRGDYQWTLPPPVPAHETRWLPEPRATATNYILGYFTGPDRSRGDFYAFEVAMALLSARLFQFARGRSLSYVASAPLLDWALPVGTIYASTSEPADLMEIVYREIAALWDFGRSRAEISRFVDQWELEHLGTRMTSAAMADALGRAQLLFGDFRAADQHMGRLRSITAPDIRGVARTYVRNLQLAFLGDTARMRGQW